jgi:hypothetical protein
MTFTFVLLLTMALPPSPPEPKLSLDVRVAGVPVSKVLWPNRRRVVV